MNADSFEKHLLRFAEDGIDSKTVISQLAEIKGDEDIAVLLNAKLQKLPPQPTETNRVILRAAYVCCSLLLSPGLIDFCTRIYALTDEGIFDVSHDLELSFIILGKLKSTTALPMLNDFANRLFEWDDMRNLNKSAIVAIAAVGSNTAISMLMQAEKHTDEIVAEFASSALRSIK